MMKMAVLLVNLSMFQLQDSQYLKSGFALSTKISDVLLLISI